MTNEQVANLILEWSVKARQMRLFRSEKALGTALGFAACIVLLSRESGVSYSEDIKQFLEREGVL